MIAKESFGMSETTYSKKVDQSSGDESVKLSGTVRYAVVDECGDLVTPWHEDHNLICNKGKDCLGEIIFSGRTLTQEIKLAKNDVTTITAAITALPGTAITPTTTTYETAFNATTHTFNVFCLFKLPVTVGDTINSAALFIGGVIFSAKNISVVTDRNPFYYIFEWNITCA
jgi:hypothetical protein